MAGCCYGVLCLSLIHILVPELGAELPVEAIAKSLALPLKPAAVTLVGKYVKLLPIDLQRDNEALFLSLIHI